MKKKESGWKTVVSAMKTPPSYENTACFYLFRFPLPERKLSVSLFSFRAGHFFSAFAVFFLMLFLPCTAIGRTVSDQAGRVVSVPEKPERVVTMAPSLSEIVCALDRCDLLKGVTQYSDYPDHVKDIQQIGPYIKPDIEKIIRLRPDLCLAVKDGNPRDTVERLSRLGVPVYVLDPHDIESVIKAVGEVGELLGAKKKADELVENMRLRITRIRKFTSSVKKRPRVFLQIGVDPIVSAGKGSFLHELVELAGAVNLAGGKTTYPRYSREQVIGLNPDILIITSMTRGQSFDEVKRKWESWSSISAVKNKKVYVIDSDLLDRPAPRMIDGLELLVKTIHPEFSIADGSVSRNSYECRYLTGTACKKK